MNEREKFERDSGDPAGDEVTWSDETGRYVPLDRYNPCSVNDAECWNWAWGAWKARADLAAKRERELKIEITTLENLIEMLRSGGSKDKERSND